MDYSARLKAIEADSMGHACLESFSKLSERFKVTLDDFCRQWEIKLYGRIYGQSFEPDADLFRPELSWLREPDRAGRIEALGVSGSPACEIQASSQLPKVRFASRSFASDTERELPAIGRKRFSDKPDKPTEHDCALARKLSDKLAKLGNDARMFKVLPDEIGELDGALLRLKFHKPEVVGFLPSSKPDEAREPESFLNWTPLPDKPEALNVSEAEAKSLGLSEYVPSKPTENGRQGSVVGCLVAVEAGIVESLLAKLPAGSPERELVEAWKAGESQTKLAKRFGVTRRAVQKRLNKLGLRVEV